MIKHCKCLSFDCDQCRQHLTQSLNTGCEKQQAVRSDKEEGFERLQDIPHQSESFKNTPLPNGIHKLFQPKHPSSETKDLKQSSSMLSFYRVNHLCLFFEELFLPTLTSACKILMICDITILNDCDVKCNFFSNFHHRAKRSHNAVPSTTV